jgi:hypothetical protein
MSNKYVSGDHFSRLKILAKYRTLDKKKIEKIDELFSNMSEEDFKNYMEYKQKESLELIYGKIK